MLVYPHFNMVITILIWALMHPHFKMGIGKLPNPHFNMVITISIRPSIRPHFKMGIPMLKWGLENYRIPILI